MLASEAVADFSVAVDAFVNPNLFLQNFNGGTAANGSSLSSEDARSLALNSILCQMRLSNSHLEEATSLEKSSTKQTYRFHELFAVLTSHFRASTPQYRRDSVILLGRVLSRCPTLKITIRDVQNIIEALCPRLSDWYFVEGSTVAFAALLDHHLHLIRQCSVIVPQPPILESSVCNSSRSGEDEEHAMESDATTTSTAKEGESAPAIRVILDALFLHVHAPAFAQGIRHNILKILTVALKNFPEDLLAIGHRAVTGICGQVENEKDPRNLLLSFPLITEVLSTFDQLISDEEQHLDLIADVLLVYFPIRFRPPANDPFQVREEDLRACLMRCMFINERLAPFIMDTVLDVLNDAISSNNDADVEQSCMALFRAFDMYKVELLCSHAEPLLEIIKLNAWQTPCRFLSSLSQCLYRLLSAIATDSNGVVIVEKIADQIVNQMCKLDLMVKSPGLLATRFLFKEAATPNVSGAGAHIVLRIFWLALNKEKYFDMVVKMILNLSTQQAVGPVETSLPTGSVNAVTHLSEDFSHFPSPSWDRVAADLDLMASLVERLVSCREIHPTSGVSVEYNSDSSYPTSPLSELNNRVDIPLDFSHVTARVWDVLASSSSLISTRSDVGSCLFRLLASTTTASETGPLVAVFLSIMGFGDIAHYSSTVASQTAEDSPKISLLSSSAPSLGRALSPVLGAAATPDEPLSLKFLDGSKSPSVSNRSWCHFWNRVVSQELRLSVRIDNAECAIVPCVVSSLKQFMELDLPTVTRMFVPVAELKLEQLSSLQSLEELMKLSSVSRFESVMILTSSLIKETLKQCAVSRTRRFSSSNLTTGNVKNADSFSIFPDNKESLTSPNVSYNTKIPRTSYDSSVNSPPNYNRRTDAVGTSENAMPYANFSHFQRGGCFDITECQKHVALLTTALFTATCRVVHLAYDVDCLAHDQQKAWRIAQECLRSLVDGIRVLPEFFSANLSSSIVQSYIDGCISIFGIITPPLGSNCVVNSPPESLLTAIGSLLTAVGCLSQNRNVVLCALRRAVNLVVDEKLPKNLLIFPEPMEWYLRRSTAGNEKDEMRKAGGYGLCYDNASCLLSQVEDICWSLSCIGETTDSHSICTHDRLDSSVPTAARRCLALLVLAGQEVTAKNIVEKLNLKWKSCVRQELGIIDKEMYKKLTALSISRGWLLRAWWLRGIDQDGQDGIKKEMIRKVLNDDYNISTPTVNQEPVAEALGLFSAITLRVILRSSTVHKCSSSPESQEQFSSSFPEIPGPEVVRLARSWLPQLVNVAKGSGAQCRKIEASALIFCMVSCLPYEESDEPEKHHQLLQELSNVLPKNFGDVFIDAIDSTPWRGSGNCHRGFEEIQHQACLDELSGLVTLFLLSLLIERKDVNNAACNTQQSAIDEVSRTKSKERLKLLEKALNPQKRFDQTIQSCLRTCYKNSIPVIRQAAIRCLYIIGQLALVYPVADFTNIVFDGLEPVLNDPRLEVRRCAAMCRNFWVCQES